MTREEMLRRTLRFERPDRYPVIHTPGTIGGTPERIKRMLALYKEFPDDFSDSQHFPIVIDNRVSPDEPYYREETDEWGCIWAFDDPILGGIVKGHPITDWKKLDSYQIPKPPLLNPDKRREFVNFLEKQKKGDYPLCGNADGALFERMQWLRGYEALLMNIVEGEEEVEILADRILNEHIIPQIEECLKLGTWFIGFTDDWGTQTSLMVSPAAWRRIFKKRYEKMASLCHQYGAYIWMHSDGEISSIIPDLIEIGIDCLNPSCMGLEKIRALTYGKITIMTDIDQQNILSHATPDKVREEVKRVISMLGHPDGGLILRGFLQINVSIENCRALLESFRDYGNIVCST